MNGKSKVIIFGGAGFLGSHLAEALDNRGWEVVIFDITNGDDIKDYEAVDNAIKDCDVVYDFASISNIDCDDASKIYETNIIGNLNILKACVKYDVLRYIYASSIYVYSDKGSFYRISKQACESTIEEYYQKHRLPYTILRFGSLYGPNANEHNWIRNMIIESINDGSMTRAGDGSEVREYIYVKDAAESCIDILPNKYIGKSITITGNEKMKTEEVMQMINEIMGGEIDISYKADNRNTHYNITPYRCDLTPSLKLTRNEYHDMGLGLLECIKREHEIRNKET